MNEKIEEIKNHLYDNNHVFYGEKIITIQEVIASLLIKNLVNSYFYMDLFRALYAVGPSKDFDKIDMLIDEIIEDMIE